MKSTTYDETKYVLVPVEPTEEMITAGAHANSEWLDDAAPLNERRYRDPAKSVYRDMLNAAPKAPDPCIGNDPLCPCQDGDV